LTRCVEAGVPPLVIKGAEHVARHFDTHGLGFLGDVDILIPRRNLRTVSAILREEGFRQARFDTDRQTMVDLSPSEIADSQRGHYELAPFGRLVEIPLPHDEYEFARRWNARPLWTHAGRVLLLVTVDVHFGIASDLSADAMVSRAVPSALGVGATFSPSDHLWFTLARYYNEVSVFGKRYLHPLVYATCILARERIDWSLVLETAAEHDLRPALYYHLLFLNKLGREAVVPKYVLRELLPARGSRTKDWGWQIPMLHQGVAQLPFDPALLVNHELRD
jgi:hypothetical protein